MINVFVTCANQDRERIRPLIRALASNSWKIFLDRPASGDKTDELAVAAALDQADCILVVWSRHSINSRRVTSIADRGRDANRLVPVLIEKVKPALRFGIIQTHDLTHTDHTRLSVELHNLKTNILRFLPKTPLPNQHTAADDAGQDADTGAAAEAESKPNPFTTTPDTPGSASGRSGRGTAWFGNRRLLLFRVAAICLMLAGAFFVWNQYDVVMQQKQQRQITGADTTGRESDPETTAFHNPDPATAPAAGPSAAAPGSSTGNGAKIFLTAQESNGIPLNEPTNQFSCSDKIFAVIEVAGLPNRQHELIAIWRDPHGKDRERTRYPFYAAGPANRIWVWLKLHRPPEAALVRFVNPSAGMEEFIGEWELRVTLNGDLLDKKHFNVLC